MPPHSSRNPVSREGHDAASEPAELPKEYIHRLNNPHAILAWGALAYYVFWSPLQTEVHTDSSGANILTTAHIDIAKLTVIKLCVALTLLTTVATVRRLQESMLPPSFLLN